MSATRLLQLSESRQMLVRLCQTVNFGDPWPKRPGLWTNFAVPCPCRFCGCTAGCWDAAPRRNRHLGLCAWCWDYSSYGAARQDRKRQDHKNWSACGTPAARHARRPLCGDGSSDLTELSLPAARQAGSKDPVRRWVVEKTATHEVAGHERDTRRWWRSEGRLAEGYTGKPRVLGIASVR